MTRKQTAAEAARDSDFARIMEGLEEVLAIEEGRADPATYRIHTPERADVKAIRKAEA